MKMFGSFIMARTLEIKDGSLELGDLTGLKPFQITASHKNKRARASVIHNLMNAAGIDLESEMFDHKKVSIYGRQFADGIITSE